MDEPIDMDDPIEQAQEMRDNDGYLEVDQTLDLLPSHQRMIERDLQLMRRFGYAFQVTRDSHGRISAVRLLEH
jgi:hypothetical protein